MDNRERANSKLHFLRSYGVAAFVIIALAVGLRLYLLAIGMPEVNGDEGTMGIEAIHIAFQGQHPVFLYGQDYMGVLEAYIATGFFHLFGISSFTLRLGMVIMFALFMVSMYFLTGLLYSKKLALVVLALLGFGMASDVLIQQLRAVGGAIETLLFGSLVLLLATWLAMTARPRREQAMRLRLTRLAAYAGWGLSAGLGLWTHFLVAPFVLVSGVMLLIFCYRDFLSFAPLVLILFFLAGFFPFIIYNLLAPPGHNTLAVIFGIHNAVALQQTDVQSSLSQNIAGTALWSLPVATGLSPVCALTNLPYYGPSNATTLPCVVEMGGWSLGYLALLAVAMLLAVVALGKLLQVRGARRTTWTAEERLSVVIHFARLMLLLCAAMTILFYVSSSLSGLKPWSTRYLVGLLIATPAVLWPLWHLARFEHVTPSSARAFISALFSRAALIVVALAILAGTVAMFIALPGVEADNQNQAGLVQNLLRIDATHVYSGYWTGGYRLVFQSQERIISAVPGGLKEPGGNRYEAYVPIVAADPRATFVFQEGSPDALAFAKKLAHSSKAYRRFDFDGYVVYQPILPTPTALSHRTCCLFQSTPNLTAGCHAFRKGVVGRGQVVSIHTQPHGWVPRESNPGPAPVRLVSIHTQPHGWVPPQSASPRVPSDEVSIHTQPHGWVPLCQVYDTEDGNIVSIHTQPHGWVPRNHGAEIVIRPRFQSTPNLTAGCHNKHVSK